MEWIKKMFEDGSSGSVSSKRVIAMLFSLCGCFSFVWIVLKWDDMVIRQSIYNSTLLFITVLLGITTYGSISKGGNDAGK